MLMHIVERAFDVAKSGEVANTRDLDRRLSSEGYTVSEISSHLTAPQIRRQLSELCRRSAFANRPDGHSNL